MSKYRTTFNLLFAFFSAWLLYSSPTVFAQNVQDFYFESFSADYHLSENSSNVGNLDISEELVAVFPNIDQNRGIERAIPKSYNDAPLNIDIKSVSDGLGRSRPFTTYDSGDFLVVRIGDPNVFVHGKQTYKINYDVRNVISFYDDHDELFWDTNGTGWSQSFERLEATFHIPSELAGSLQPRQECYSGGFGVAGRNCKLSRFTENDETTISVSAANISAGENVSVALAFDKGEFEPDPWLQIRKYLNIAALVGLPVLAIAYSYTQWRRHGRDDDRRGYVTPQYVPPAGLNVVSSEVILEEKLSSDGVSAGILQLATMGYVKIIDTEKKRRFRKDRHEFSIELTKELAGAPKELQEVALLLFKPLPTDPKQALKQIFAGNFSSISNAFSFVANDPDIQPGAVVNLEESKNKLYTGVQAMTKEVPKRLARGGYFKVAPEKAKSSWAGKSVLVGIFSIPFFLFGSLQLVGVGFIIAGISMLLWVDAMPARSKLGSQALDHLEGLKEYITLAEADRLAFHQSVEGSRYGAERVNSNEFKLRIYEELLPYAMLFGLAESWSEQFKDLYQQPPDWYNSNSSTFNTLLLANSLSSFSSSSAAAFSPPASSGSSGGSGFGGGGFSGGGGGGGGGGGW